MHLILTGATGLVGSSVLSYALSLPASSPLTKLTLLTRRPVSLASSHQPQSSNLQVETITHSDFTSYPPDLLSKLKGANGVVWALGVSQNAVSKDECVKITKHYPLAAAKAFSDLNPDGNFNFVYVSGEGATLSPGRFTQFFGKIKGETERELVELLKQSQYSRLRIMNARPGAVDSSHDPLTLEATKNQQKPMWYKASKPILMPLISNLYRNMYSPTKELGQALTQLAMSDGEPIDGKGVEAEGRTLTNAGLRRLAGLM